jgi:tetratricopeptide (TPR) repeat protein/tRNA A-37 threonylcarbamoyl transferase component Bud32
MSVEEKPQAYLSEEGRRTAGLSPTEEDGAARTAVPATMTSPLARPVPAASVDPAPPGYEILDVLGRGGMGIVYKARHRKLGRIVALKMILSRAHATMEQRVRFQIEAEAVAHLQHPNIVQLHEAGEHDGLPFFSLEFCDGGSLTERLGKQKPTVREAAALVETLARATHYAHMRGIVHRDLKPGNVLIADCGLRIADSADQSAIRNPQSAVYKITDFGLAKRMDGSANDVTRTGVPLGTPAYMAPEQAEGRSHDVSPATDVWSLGAILYECLTARPPFTGSTAVVVASIIAVDPPTPESICPGLPKDLVTICLKCLSKEPSRRYATAEALAEDLRRFLHGEPITARRTGRLERAWKWIRREPAQAAACVAVAVAVVGAAVGAISHSRYREQQATARTEKLERREKLRQNLDRLNHQADEAEQASRFADARQYLSEAVVLLDEDPEAFGSDVRPRLQENRNRVQRKLEERETGLQKTIARQEAARDFAGRVERFGRHRDHVLFHAISVREQDVAGDVMQVRRAALEALDEFGLDVAKQPDEFAVGLAQFRSIAQTSAQLDRAAADCYHVLLAWATIETTAGAETNPGRALKLLDAAAALAAVHHLETPRIFHLRRARCHELLGDEKAAKTDRDCAAAIAPNVTADLLDSALEHYGKGRIDEAEADCERIFQKEPNHFWAQFVASLCNLRRQQWSVAVVRLNACLEKQPDTPWLLMHRALAHAGAERFDAAEADFRKALDGASDDAFRAMVLTNRSVVSMQRKHWADAERDLREVIVLAPKGYEGHVNLALAYKKQGKHDAAIGAMDEAIKRQPEQAALYAVRARLHLDRGDTKLARPDFEAFLKREPKGSSRWTAAQVDLARLELKVGSLDAALTACDAALAFKPDYAEAHQQRAEVLLLRGKYAEAGTELDRYLACGGKETPEIHRARGQLHMRAGKHAAAVDSYSLALGLRKDAETHCLRGWAYLAQEAVRPALADFDAALVLDKSHTDALCGRATALVRLGRATDAEINVEDALKAQTRSPQLLLQVASIYGLAVGQPGSERDAVRYQDRALALLDEAMTRLVEEKAQQTFWRDQVEKAPGLEPIRGSSGYKRLAAKYGPR